MIAAKTRRRIVRRAVMTLAVVVLLPVWYVSVFWATCWADWRISRVHYHPSFWSNSIVFQPLHDYSMSDLPGSRHLAAISTWFMNGMNGPLSAEYEFTDKFRKQWNEDRRKGPRAPR